MDDIHVDIDDDHDGLTKNSEPLSPEFEDEPVVQGSVKQVVSSSQDEDDEFGYALEGGQREGEFHKRVFQAKALPAHLVTDVHQQSLGAVIEECGEEEEEVEEHEEQAHRHTHDGHDDTVEEGEEVIIHDDDDFAAPSSPLPIPELVSTPAPAQDQPTPTVSTTTNPEINTIPSPDRTSDHISSSDSSTPLPAVLQPSSSPHIHSPGPPELRLGAKNRLLGDMASSPGGASRPLQSHLSPNRAARPMHAGTPSNIATKQTFSPAISDTPLSQAPNTPHATDDQLPSIKLLKNLSASGSAPGSFTAKLSSAPSTPKGDGKAANSANGFPPSSPQQLHIDEWELANQRLKEIGTSLDAPAPSPVSFHEALLYFNTEVDISAYRDMVSKTLPPEPSFFSRLLCIAPPKLTPALEEQQMRVLCIARIPFDDAQRMHVPLLNSIYNVFTGKQDAPSRFGSHWAELGFQGQDPATDLRGCGMFGLLQLYYLYQHEPANAKALLALSQSRVQEFPLSIVSMNVTKWTLQAVRAGRLNSHSLAKRSGSLIEVANTFYVGVFYEFYNRWVSGNKTMRESGFVLRDLEAHCEKRTGDMLKLANTKLKSAC